MISGNVSLHVWNSATRSNLMTPLGTYLHFPYIKMGHVMVSGKGFEEGGPTWANEDDFKNKFAQSEDYNNFR